MPVGYGERYFRVALGSFLSQVYDDLELVVLDNSGESIEPLLPHDSRIKYFHCPRMPVGALRNLGTRYATGEICITWDEDDFSHPDRVKEQVKRLLASGKAVTGWHNIFYWDECTGKAYKYFYDPSGRNHPPYAMGTSQCYLKSWWEKHPFPETGVEDQAFSNKALHAGQLDSCDAGCLCVARAHKDSACPATQLGTHKQFPEVSKDLLPKEFFAAIGEEQ